MIKLPPKDKPIRLKTDKWQELRDLADELAADLGISVSLPDAISHLLKFYRERQTKTQVEGKDAAANN